MDEEAHGAGEGGAGEGGAVVTAFDDAATEQTSTHEEVAETGSGGMPQLDFSTFDNQIFWLLVALASIFLIVRRVAMPRIGTVLASRQGTIGNDLGAAETMRAQAREAQEAYDRALAEARAEANRVVGEARAEIQAQLDADLRAADARIAAQAAESARRLAEIAQASDQTAETVARDAARAILQALGGRPDDAGIDAAVTQRMRA